MQIPAEDTYFYVLGVILILWGGPVLLAESGGLMESGIGYDCGVSVEISTRILTSCSSWSMEVELLKYLTFSASL